MGARKNVRTKIETEKTELESTMNMKLHELKKLKSNLTSQKNSAPLT